MIKKTIILCGLLVATLPVACGAPTKTVPDRYSKRGETCDSTNMCDSGLLCINAVCTVNEFPSEPTAKVCETVECQADADCCADFVVQDFCMDYQDSCTADPVLNASDCDMYDEYCVCNKVCDERQQCEGAAETCTTDDDCGFYLDTCNPASGECVECLQDLDCSGSTPTCDPVEFRCVECTGDADCDAAAGEVCVEGECGGGCKSSEECPFFHSCNAGTCEATGCVNDRECVLLSGKPDSKCILAAGDELKSCKTPCQTNAECPELNVCKSGECVYYGCESDAECLNIEKMQDGNYNGLPEGSKVVCRAPASLTAD